MLAPVGSANSAGGPRTAARGRARLFTAALALALAGLLGACGSSGSATRAPRASCPQTVLDALVRVVRHVYHEGISSERTVVARAAVAHSLALRAAVEAQNPAATRAAARALVASGHLTNLRVVAGGRLLAAVGGAALTPLSGTITGAHRTPIATYETSVWSTEGFVAESNGIGEGLIALRAHDRGAGGSISLPAGRLAPSGTLSHRGVEYQFSSFGARSYPAGAERVYLLKPVSSTLAFCGASSEDTTANILSHVARRLYEGEAGTRTQPQVRRVQRDRALLAAVARRDASAARGAVARLLTEHIVRLRVNAAGKLLADVGGPYVLGPVTAPLELGGHAIGSLVLSIQDDEGYMRLAKRLVGLDVLMYMGPRLVKNSLGPEPGQVPESGPFSYRGRRFRVYTLHVTAFPAGPLRINVLIPIPYL